MNNRQVILHIGTEKTGTSCIQKFLGVNHEKIKEQGVRTFSGIIGNQNNFELVLASEEVAGDDLVKHRKIPFTGFRQKIIKDISFLKNDFNDEILLFSSEHFSSRLATLESVSALKSLFPQDTNFKIILYLKSQSLLYFGSVGEQIKAGSSFDNIISMENILKREWYGSSYYDYQNLISRWSSVFGKESIVIKRFDQDAFFENNLLTDFCNAVGLNSENLDFNIADVNKSLSPEALFLIDKLCERYNYLQRREVVNILEEIDPFEKGVFGNMKEVKHFLKLFYKTNDWVSHHYFQGKPLFVDESLDRIRYVDVNDIENNENIKKVLFPLFEKWIKNN